MTDLPAIYRGEENYIRSWEPAHEASWRCELERHLTRWVENLDRLTIAVVDECFAGFVLWIPDGARAELYTLHVDPHYRRCGTGTALLEAYVADAAQQGFTQFRLSVRPDNPARILYQKAGFECSAIGAHGYLTYERCM